MQTIGGKNLLGLEGGLFHLRKKYKFGIIISNMKPNQDWNQNDQNYGVQPNNFPQNQYPQQQNYGGYPNEFTQNGQFPAEQNQQQFGVQYQNYGAQQNYPQYPNGYQNQPQYPQQPVQNPSAAPNLMPNQNYNGSSASENPYTVEYLNKISPKKAVPFWTKGKILVASALAIALFFAIFIIATAGKSDDSTQKVLRAYYNIVKLKEITGTYQKKIKSSDLAAVNAGINISLSSDEQILTEYMKSKKIDVPRGDSRKKSEIYKQTETDFNKLDTTLDDAFLNATIDEVYSREMAYQLVRVKNLIVRHKKTAGSVQKKMYAKIEKNLEESSKQLENYKK